MQPKGPLMIEHRLIERMIALMDREAGKIEKSREISLPFIIAAADFMRTYADKTHHGKEEGILFRDLNKKPLSEGEMRLMHELIHEHEVSRALTADLDAAAAAYQRGDASGMAAMANTIRRFIEFYPNHIDREDNTFFPSAMEYFSVAEQGAMLDEFREFDRKMIHMKYKNLVESLET